MMRFDGRGVPTRAPLLRVQGASMVELLFPCQVAGCLNLVPTTVDAEVKRQTVRDYLESRVAYTCGQHQGECSTI